jgi:hypothetical protein
MGGAMSERKPWFLVMTPADANRPDAPWLRHGAASRRKVVATPIAIEGWLVILGFVAALVAVMLLIWIRGVAGGALSILAATIMTAVVAGAIVGGFACIVRSRSVRLPPQAPP